MKALWLLILSVVGPALLSKLGFFALASVFEGLVNVASVYILGGLLLGAVGNWLPRVFTAPLPAAPEQAGRLIAHELQDIMAHIQPRDSTSPCHSLASHDLLQLLPPALIVQDILPRLSVATRHGLAVTCHRLFNIVASTVVALERRVELDSRFSSVLTRFVCLQRLHLRHAQLTPAMTEVLRQGLPALQHLHTITFIPDLPELGLGTSRDWCNAFGAALPASVAAITLAPARHELSISEACDSDPKRLALIHARLPPYSAHTIATHVEQLQRAFCGTGAAAQRISVRHTAPLVLDKASAPRCWQLRALATLQNLSSLQLCLPFAADVMSPKDCSTLSALSRLTELALVSLPLETLASAPHLSQEAVRALVAALPNLVSVTVNADSLQGNDDFAASLAHLATLERLTQLQLCANNTDKHGFGQFKTNGWVQAAALAPLRSCASLRRLVVHSLRQNNDATAPPLLQPLRLAVCVIWHTRHPLHRFVPNAVALDVFYRPDCSARNFPDGLSDLMHLEELTLHDLQPRVTETNTDFLGLGEPDVLLCKNLPSLSALRRLRLRQYSSVPQLRALLGAAARAGGGGLLELEIRAAKALPRHLALVAQARTTEAHLTAAKAWGVQGPLFQGFACLEQLVVVGQVPELDVVAEIVCGPPPALQRLQIGGIPGALSLAAMRQLHDCLVLAGVTVQVMTES